MSPDGRECFHSGPEWAAPAMSVAAATTSRERGQGVR